MAPGTSLARTVRRTGVAWLVCGAAATLGCGGEVVSLGSSGLEAGGTSGAGGNVAAHVWDLQSTPIFEQESGLLLANPTLTDDEGTLYYSVQERYGKLDPPKPYIEAAAADGGGWATGVAQKLGELKDPDISSPAVSGDGTELWLGMNDSDNTDIFKSVRQGDAWTTPQKVAELCSVDDDAPRPPAVSGTIMPLSSKRHGGSLYQIYLSQRENMNAVWSEPSKALLAAVNSDDFQSADGFLGSTGLELYFSSTRDGDHADSDLYVARRPTLTDAFGAPEALTDLNDPEGRSQERMPWLSPDGQSLYFVSDRTGQYTLYLATKVDPSRD